MREIQNIKQHSGEPFRRWFTGQGMDLIVWQDDAHQPVGFQLLFATRTNTVALTWREHTGFSYHRVDDGEPRTRKRKPTPILVGGSRFNKRAIRAHFKKLAADIDPSVFLYVSEKLSLATTQIS